MFAYLSPANRRWVLVDGGRARFISVALANDLSAAHATMLNPITTAVEAELVALFGAPV